MKLNLRNIFYLIFGDDGLRHGRLLDGEMRFPSRRTQSVRVFRVSPLSHSEGGERIHQIISAFCEAEGVLELGGEMRPE